MLEIWLFCTKISRDLYSRNWTVTACSVTVPFFVIWKKICLLWHYWITFCNFSSIHFL